MRKSVKKSARKSAGEVSKPIVGTRIYAPGEMERRCRRKTVTDRDVLQALADMQVINASDDPTEPGTVWLNRCLSRAAEIITGKAVAA